MQQYISWIFENVKDPKNKCVEATLEMKKVFPELIRVGGHYRDSLYGKRPHWWLETPEGRIIDPTVQQFSDVESWCIAGLDDQYEPIDKENPPTGKCVECGEYTYNHKGFCGDVCNKICADRYNRK